MATIQSTIELYDRFSAPMQNIVNVVSNSLPVLESLQDSLSQTGNTKALQGVQDALNGMLNTTKKLNESLLSTWGAVGMESFTTTGTERFMQEINSANAMLHTLRKTQASISQTAANMDILPESAVNNMNGISARLLAVQQRMTQLANTPVELRTEAANNELEQIRQHLSDAGQAQAQLNAALQSMDAEAANAAYYRLSQTIASAEQGIRNNTDAQGNFNQKLQEGTTAAGGLWDKIKGFVGAYAGIQAIGKVVNISDAFSNVQARLGSISFEGDTTGVDGMVQMVYQAAQSARGSFTDMADVVARFGNNAKDAFGSSAEVVRFAELVQKQMTISGTSTQEASNAMLQLSQALGSGVLRGDELNSIFEQSPALIQRIADYMGVSIGQIRELASEGQLTADIVKSAIMGAGEDIDAQFESMPTTWAQVWTSFQNSAMMAFQPVLSKITELASSNAVQTFVSNARGALTNLANVANAVIDAVAGIADFFTNNWSLIAPIVLGVAAAFTTYEAALAAVNIVKAISTALETAHTLAVTAHAVMTRTATSATIAAAAAQTGLNATLLACPLTWIVAGIIAAITAVFLVIAAFNKLTGSANSTFGTVCGCISVTGAFFKNLGMSVADVALGIWNALGACASNIETAFHNAISNIQGWFYSLLSTALTVVAGICEGLNKLPFIEFDYSGISDKANEYAAKSAEAYGNVKEYEDVAAAFNKGMSTFDTFQDGWVESAFNAGTAWGNGVVNKFSGSTAEQEGTDDYTSLLDNIANNTATTANNTSTLSDTSEELAYMRDLAEQEVINRYTTAEITINQSNSNTVNSGMDLDGVTSALTDGIFEAIATATEGVYA